MEGLRRVLEARATEMLVQPLIFLLLAVLAYGLVLGLSAAGAMALRVAATSAAFVVGVVWARRFLPPEVRTSPPVYATGTWLGGVLPLLAIALTSIVRDRAPVLVLGAVAGQAAAGLFAVAAGVTDIIAFVFLALSAPVAPAVARLHAAGKVLQLQHLATKSARVMVALAMPLAAILVAFGASILRLVGPDFVQAHRAVVILAIGQLVTAIFGSASTVLTMTGHERDTFKGSLLSALLSIGLNVALIPRWGLEGAAAAVAASAFAGNLAIGGLVCARLRIDPTALGWRLARQLPEADR
jgi:O-antigen/teichoic acid export membrane protein